MATYVIVEHDKDPLGPNEIPAGQEISVASGDVFIISAAADQSIDFVSASGSPTNFEIRFEESNPNDFNVDIGDDLDAGIVISSGADLSDVDIDADNSLSVIMTVGDNVALGRFLGSDTGTDAVTIGNGFSTDHDIDLNGGDNFLSIGDNATVRNIETGDGDDWINIGDGLVANDILTGGGDDTIAIGDNATLKKIDSGDGDDSIVIGDGLVADAIKTRDGADELTIGDDAVVHDVTTGKGDDLVTVGDNFTAHKLKTQQGDDTFVSGSGGSIDDLDGGKGTDTLDSETDYADQSNFEIICFARGTRIETADGDTRVEDLQIGDRVMTLDHGFQAIRWIGSTRVPGRGAHAPVRIAAGALGNARALWLSQQHRMLLSGWECQLHFGEEQTLVPAKHLVGLSGVEIVEIPVVEYFHILFDTHEIVFAEGAPSESFHPGAVGIGNISEAQREEIFSLFPRLRQSLASFGAAARYSLLAYEARLFAA